MSIINDLTTDLCDGLQLLSNNTYHMSSKDITLVVRMLHSVAERLHGEILYAEDMEHMAEQLEYASIAKSEADSYYEENM